MNKSLRNIFSIAAFCIGCFFVFGCENDPEKVKEWNRRNVKPDEARSVEAYFSQTGVMKAKLTSPLMYRYQQDTVYTEFPNTLHVDFFDANKNIESKVDARYGKYFETYDKILLKDSVVVINVKGDTLWTSELWWDQHKEKFYTDKPYRFHTKIHKIAGPLGLEARQDLTGVIFFQPSGTILVEDSVMN
jgi:LPS export ABC transporter protein LptC